MPDSVDLEMNHCSKKATTRTTTATAATTTTATTATATMTTTTATKPPQTIKEEKMRLSEQTNECK